MMAKKGMKHCCTRYKKSDAAAEPHADMTPAVFPAIDNDLAVENLVNDFDMTAADRQDLTT